MRDLRLFGFNPPLRASSLPYLIRCPWRAALLYLDLFGDKGGKAAQTGSLAHVGIESWHTSKSVEKALAAMAARLPDFPEADEEDAQRHVKDYTADPRNAEAEIVGLEVPVTLELPAAEGDPTRRPIRITGTVDQIRRINGTLRIIDVKTGSPGGWDMLNDYAYQIAAYAKSATHTLKQPVLPGALIRTQGYRKRGVDPKTGPDGVFFWVPWGLEEAELLLDNVRAVVSQIRSYEPPIGPGAHCSWCPAGGLENCLPEYRRLSGRAA